MNKQKNKNIPFTLGQIIETNIIDLTSTGEGVSKPDDYTVFIDNTVPGDRVKAKITELKPSYGKAELLGLLSSSKDRRTESFCPYSDVCGGCSFNAITYKKQLEIKEKTVRDALERIGGFKDLDILPIIGGDEFNYRNKAQFKVSDEGLGFYEKRSHNLIPIKSCKIQSVYSSKLIEKIDSIIKHYKIEPYNETTHTGLLRGVLLRNNRENETMIVFIINGNSIPNQKKIVKELSEDPNIISIYLNINKNKSNTILGKETIELFKRKALTEHLGDKSFLISPESFFQVNPEQTEILYQIVKDYAELKPNENLYDLYCGTGTIGIYCYEEGVKLTGIEINKEAVKDAIINAENNNIKNFKYYAGKAEVIAPTLNDRPDCIILDPPRKGCDKNLLDLLLELRSKRIVYISCNPATLARDLKILSEDYSILKVQPVDLFPQTGHVETVVQLILK